MSIDLPPAARMQKEFHEVNSVHLLNGQFSTHLKVFTDGFIGTGRECLAMARFYIAHFLPKFSSVECI